uniref:EGF-like domain-containing protein n=1 Tax=Romanomermis culicivorax TaxID=13658 RepID=A0A915JHU0_ROMCU
MPCGSAATCFNTQGSFYCMCADGSRGSPTCTNGSTTSCPPGYCKNGGTCSSTGFNTYKCACPAEFSGSQCDSVLCNTGWRYFSGFCYAAFNVNMTEQMAKTYCANTGAQLASIGSTAERNFAGAL